MSQTAWIVVAVVVLVAGLIVAGMVASRRRRSDRLKDRFGREYDRTLEATGDRSKAETELEEREKRVEKLDIRSLERAERREFLDRWTDVQARFVDDPARAVAFADALLGDVMKARGYPVSDFEQRAGDISVDHPGRGRALPQGARDRGPPWARRSKHRGLAAGDDPLSRLVRQSGRGQSADRVRGARARAGSSLNRRLDERQTLSFDRVLL